MNNQALENFTSRDKPTIIHYPLSFELKDGSIIDKFEEGVRKIKVAPDATTYSEYRKSYSALERIIAEIPTSNVYHNLKVQMIEGKVVEGTIEYRLNPRIRMRVFSSVNRNSEPKTTVLQTDVVLGVIKNVAIEAGLDVDLLFNTVSKFIAIDGDVVYILKPVLQEN